MKKYILFFAFLCLSLTRVYSQSVISVAAAANTRDAMQEIKDLFLAENPSLTLNINYGSSGVFVQQILNGASYHLFLSADEDFAKKVEQEGLSEGEIMNYAGGKLVLYSRMIDVSTLGMASFEDQRVTKIAVANPKAAPYGARAIEMLEMQNIYESVKSKIIYGENIGATAQYVFSANVELGVIALSQVKSPDAQIDGFCYEIPSQMYNPVIQSCVLVKQKSDMTNAVRFRDFLFSEQARAVWDKYGYDTF